MPHLVVGGHIFENDKVAEMELEGTRAEDTQYIQ